MRIPLKILRQMDRRGWSVDLIRDTIEHPHAIRPALNRAGGNEATAYFRRDGSYVVKDNRTGEIVQISNRNDQNWVPDSSIVDPPRGTHP